MELLQYMASSPGPRVIEASMECKLQTTSLLPILIEG